MRRLMPAVTVAAVALLLATSVDYVAYATTGRSLILGQLNVGRHDHRGEEHRLRAGHDRSR